METGLRQKTVVIDVVLKHLVKRAFWVGLDLFRWRLLDRTPLWSVLNSQITYDSLQRQIIGWKVSAYSQLVLMRTCHTNDLELFYFLST